MTAENNGTGAAPEGDDPFAYLYRQEGGDGSTAQQAGVPRRSYNQVRAVGERHYGTQQTYQAQQPYPPYGQDSPSAHYAAPETVPGGRAATRQGPPPQRNGHAGGGAGHGGHGGHGGGGGRSRNGLLIGAIAVVAAVVVGIGAAVFFTGDGQDGEGAQAGDAPSASAGAGDNGGDQQKKPNDGGRKTQAGKQVSRADAATLRLDGGATAASDVPGAKGKNGLYVGAMNKPGASATWTINNVPKAGQYTLFVRYGVPGVDANSTLSVNGRPRSQPLNMQNFAGAQKGDWGKGWTRTFAWVNLKKGQNSVRISCEQGNKCNFNLDQVWLKSGQVKK